jgi:hypothetical protein
MTQVTLDGVMQGNGGATEEERRNGFVRGGWASGQGDHETDAFINQAYQRAEAFPFGRRTYELFAGSWGLTRPRVLRLGRLEEAKHVLRTRCRPKSEELVIRIGEGPAAADRHQARVPGLREDHGRHSLCSHRPTSPPTLRYAAGTGYFVP